MDYEVKMDDFTDFCYLSRAETVNIHRHSEVICMHKQQTNMMPD